MLLLVLNDQFDISHHFLIFFVHFLPQIHIDSNLRTMWEQTWDLSDLWAYKSTTLINVSFWNEDYCVLALAN